MQLRYLPVADVNQNTKKSSINATSGIEYRLILLI